MMKAGIDQEAIVKMFSEASAKQGEALRKGVAEATLKALQGRELTMENIKKVLKTVTQAASAGAAQNVASPVDVETMLAKAFAGMDGAYFKPSKPTTRRCSSSWRRALAFKTSSSRAPWPTSSRWKTCSSRP